MRSIGIWLAALLFVACGGGEKFPGDNVIADLRGGQPYCGQGRTGPTISSHTAVGRGADGQPFTSTITECDWTCGNTGPLYRAFVFVIFYTDEHGVWWMDPHADPSRGSCPDN